MNQSPEFQFAKEVIQRLTDSGFEALLAGGCVRDYLLGLKPKDYDVATNATPNQVQETFGKRKTIAIGAAFGVITVIGNKKTGNIEVATFRQDGNYADGRRPDLVTFCNAKEDALRRDFTINGLFFDLKQNQVVDYVDGQKDLENQVIRAIGNPEERFSEDRLRMLRAVRFATTLDFQIEKETQFSIQKLSQHISQISAERIATEMGKLLRHSNRHTGLRLLYESKLTPAVFEQWWGDGIDRDQLERESEQLKRLDLSDLNHETTLPTVIAVLLWLRWERQFSEKQTEITEILKSIPTDSEVGKFSEADQLKSLDLLTEAISPTLEWSSLQVKQWKLSNLDLKVMEEAFRCLPALILANKISWSKLQPNLIGKFMPCSLQVAGFACRSFDLGREPLKVCREKMDLPPTQLNPLPLLDGKRLQEMGVSKGPDIGRVMKSLRTLQLDEVDFQVEEAENWVRDYLANG